MGYHSLTTTTHPLNFNLPSSWQQSTTRLPARKVSVGWGNRAQDPLVRDATRVKHPSHNSGYGARLTSEPFWTWWQSDNPGRTTNRPRTIIRLRYYSSVTGTQKQYMIYLLTAIGLSASGSITVHIYTQTIPRTTQWKQNMQNRTYITVRIHKHNNKNTQFTKLNKSIQNIHPYIQW